MSYDYIYYLHIHSYINIYFTYLPTWRLNVKWILYQYYSISFYINILLTCIISIYYINNL